MFYRLKIPHSSTLRDFAFLCFGNEPYVTVMVWQGLSLKIKSYRFTPFRDTVILFIF